jgi:hypothetical protein
MIPLLALIVLLNNSSGSDPAIRDLGIGVKTMKVSGTFSTSGDQNLSGLPFSALMDTSDAFRLTIGGPFGITTARMWAERDTFVFVNYLMQEAHEGRPDAKSLQRVLPFPLPASYLMALMRGKAPGNSDRFSRSEPRTDGSVLFEYHDTSGVEYLLIDTVHSLIRQYQRKGLSGEIQLDVAFKDVSEVSSVQLAHVIDISVQDKHQTASFRIEHITINEPIQERLMVDIPPTFVRTSYR